MPFWYLIFGTSYKVKSPHKAGFPNEIDLGLAVDLSHIHCRQPLRTLFNVIVYLLVLCQSLETVTLDCAEMNEYVITTVILNDETKTLRVVEELYCTCCHVNYYL